jgi:hypothetical protein
MSHSAGSGILVTTRPLRLITSLLAAATSVQLCASLKHFTIDLAYPSTLALPFEHRCGRLMVLCCLWALLEVSGFALEALRWSGSDWTFGAQ